jgi:hypothetical protein
MENLRTDTPVWLLDVDGVINVEHPGWGTVPRTGYAWAGSEQYKIRWAPALVGFIGHLHTTDTVEVRWCTTWCAYADELERLFRLPRLGRAFTDSINGEAAAMAKLAAARQVLAEGRRLIWTDDTEVPLFGPLHDELTRDGRALLIRPRSSIGLQPEHLHLIEAFSTTPTPERSL